MHVRWLGSLLTLTWKVFSTISVSQPALHLTPNALVDLFYGDSPRALRPWQDIDQSPLDSHLSLYRLSIPCSLQRRLTFAEEGPLARLRLAKNVDKGNDDAMATTRAHSAKKACCSANTQTCNPLKSMRCSKRLHRVSNISRSIRKPS